MIDDQLTTEIKFANQTYEGDSFVSFGTSQEDESYLRIVNAMGHRVIGIRDSSYKNYAGKLVFTRGAERYEAPVSGGNDRYYVELPNVSGTFDVTYTFAEDEQIPERPRPDVSGKWEDWLNTKDTVPNNYTWTINLSSAPMSTTVNTNNVFVVDEQGYLVEGVQVKVEGTRILVSAPMSGYEAGKAYQLYIRDSVKNGEGKKLVNTKMSFNVK